MDADLSILSPRLKPRAYSCPSPPSRGPDAGPGGETVGRGRLFSEGEYGSRACKIGTA